MSKKKQEPTDEEKVALNAKTEVFIGEIRKLCELHSLDIVANLQVTENGIVPMLKIIERPYGEPNNEHDHDR